MSRKSKQFLDKAKELLVASREKADSGSFSHNLQALSLQSHIDDLETFESLEKIGQTYELVDFRMMADTFRSGSVPLNIVAKSADELRKMLGYAALRFIHGGISRKRVPADLYEDLDLRLAGILPGSSRLLVAIAAHRDLFDDGVAKHAIERIFGVLESNGRGGNFLEAVTDLGPSSARSLREFLKIIRAQSGALEVSWTFSGQNIHRWTADQKTVADIASALEVTTLKEQNSQIFTGVIELLSKRERIHLRANTGEILRILFPKRLLADVSELHLDQEVRLLCQVTETENPLTNETAHHYELLEIRR